MELWKLTQLCLAHFMMACLSSSDGGVWNLFRNHSRVDEANGRDAREGFSSTTFQSETMDAPGEYVTPSVPVQYPTVVVTRGVGDYDPEEDPQLAAEESRTDRRQLAYSRPARSRSTSLSRRPRGELVYQLRTKTTSGDNECWVTVRRTEAPTKATSLTYEQKLRKWIREETIENEKREEEMKKRNEEYEKLILETQEMLNDTQKKFDAKVEKGRAEDEERRRTDNTTECYLRSKHFVATSLFWTVSLPFIVGMTALFIISLIMCKIRC